MKKKGTKSITVDVNALSFTKSKNSANAILIFKGKESQMENVQGEAELLGYILASKGKRDDVLSNMDSFNTIEFSFSTTKRTYIDDKGKEQESIKRLTPTATS